MKSYLVFQSLFVLIFSESNLDIRIQCPLQWTTFDSGFSSQQLPANAIKTNVDGNLAVRVTKNNSGSYVGQLDPSEMVAYASIPLFSGIYTSEIFDTFDVLTNPFGCYTQWMHPFHEDVPKFQVDLGICRSDSTKLPGFTSGLFAKKCITAVGENDVDESQQFNLLISYRKGVTTKVTNFKLAIEPNSEDGELDFLGLDELTNNANVTVIHVVTHTKKVSEKISYTETTSTSSAVSVTHGFGLFLEEFGYGANINFEKGEGETSGNSETLSNSTERIVTVSREVVVPPYTSLTVCSTIAFNDKYNSTFNAIAEFSSPGLSALQVQNHIVSLGMEGPFTRMGSVVSKKIVGSIAATLSMETQFIVTPQKSFRGCEDIVQDVVKNKKRRIEKNFKRIKSQ